ncbi:sensor histidine kinase [Fulvimarina endophytica]|uniref:histidine kinase n=1 Tax=Fulvimarina endophytica TaxID=2293836 RepID=A0A371WZ13_9HYPH|nr:ATP-binding protein [Fulvimarina endophytica]RFC62014.1 sensor histidine kinase [Fulvimarina endophytica]
MTPFHKDVRHRTVIRWSAGLAALLMLQMAVLAGLVALFLSVAQSREIETELGDFCEVFSSIPPDRRAHELEESIRADIHRQRIVLLEDAGGRPLAGNAAAIPAALEPDRPAREVSVLRSDPVPTVETRVVGRLCGLLGGQRLFVGLDRGQNAETVQLVEKAFLLALIPASIFALLGGLIIGDRAVQRLDAVRRLSERIIAGDLKKRLPVARKPDVLGALNIHINTMLDRIEMLMVELRGLGDDIAHQLKTPLTRLKTKLDRVVANAEKGEVPLAAAEDALAECRNAMSIVSSLLRIRELDDRQKRALFAPLRLDGIVADVHELFAPFADERGASLALKATPIAVMGDRDLLMEALANLVENALKFGPHGAAIEIALVAVEGGAELEVSDGGTGFAPGEIDQIGQRFFRGREAEGIEGVGLGLALVHAVARLHGFTLSSRLASAGGRHAMVLSIPQGEILETPPED